MKHRLHLVFRCCLRNAMQRPGDAGGRAYALPERKPVLVEYLQDEATRPIQNWQKSREIGPPVDFPACKN